MSSCFNFEYRLRYPISISCELLLWNQWLLRLQFLFLVFFTRLEEVVFIAAVSNGDRQQFLLSCGLPLSQAISEIEFVLFFLFEVLLLIVYIIQLIIFLRIVLPCSRDLLLLGAGQVNVLLVWGRED